MMRTFFLVSILASLWAEYKQEGYYAFYDGDQRPFFMSLFLPYNPNVLSFCEDAEDVCLKTWYGNASFTHAKDKVLSQSYDLIWLESENELEILSRHRHFLENARLIYTSTHLHDHSFERLKAFLELSDFSLLTHWYWEKEKGHALFLKKPFFEAYVRTLAFTPPPIQMPHPIPPTSNIEQFFKPALGKSGKHSMEGIDFIYMINLDERPEKFSLASEALNLYGIDPYRFSAVNGWKLPTTALAQLGAVFTPGTLQDSFIGSSYLEINGKEVMHSGLLQEDGSSYFTWGLARGPVGIILSHLSVLQDAYDSGFNTIWVMEDDVEAIDNPRKISGLLKTLDQLAPDWDIFFTDTDTKDTEGIHIPCRALAARPNVDIPPFSTFIERFYGIGEGLYRTGMRYGAYSMIFRRSGMKKVLDYYKTYKIFLPYDMDLWLCPDLKMYHYEHDIVSHRSKAPSDNNAPRYKHH